MVPDPDAALREFEADVAAAPGRCEPRPPSWRPTWPARPPSAIPATSPRPRRCSSGPARAPTAAGARRRSGGWMTGRRPPATGWRSRRPVRSSASPAQPLQPAGHHRRQRSGEDPPAPRASATRSPQAPGAGGLPQRARVHRRADRGDRPRRGRHLARALPPRRPRSCSTTCISSAEQGPDARTSCSCSSTCCSSRAGRWSSPPPCRSRSSTGVEPRLRTRLEGGLVVRAAGARPRDACQRASRASSRRREWARRRGAGAATSPRARRTRSGRCRAQCSGCSNAAEARSVPPSVALAREVLDGVLPALRRAAPAGPPRRPRVRGRAGSSPRPPAVLGAGRRWCGSGPSWATACSRSGADGDQGQPQGGQSSRRHPAALPRATDRLPRARRPAQLRHHLLRRGPASSTPRS